MRKLYEYGDVHIMLSSRNKEENFKMTPSRKLYILFDVFQVSGGAK